MLLAGIFAYLAFLVSWVGLGILGLYILVICILFEETWLVRGPIFLLIPLGIAMGLGVVGVPDWTTALAFIIGYILIGGGWSVFKWFRFCSKLKEIIEKYVASGTDQGYRTIEWNQLTTAEKGSALWTFLDRKYLSNRLCISDFFDKDDVLRLQLSPVIGKNKARVFSWILNWPFSVVEYIFDKLLKDLVDLMVELLKSTYARIGKLVFSNIKV